MRIFLNCTLALFLLISFQTSFSQTLDEFIKKAEGFNQTGDVAQSAKVMEEAIQKFPDQSTAYSYLGLYRGMQAGRTQN